jgi:hypothetical protein
MLDFWASFSYAPRHVSSCYSDYQHCLGQPVAPLVGEPDGNRGTADPNDTKSLLIKEAFLFPNDQFGLEILTG